MADISQLLLAKSDQSNAADLIGAPVVGTIVRVEVKDSPDQPMSIWMDCLPKGRPWRPCKTAMRILSFGWGPETDAWVGRRVGLYYEPKVSFGKDQTGGIRVQSMSHTRGFRISLAERRGQFRLWEIEGLPDTGPRRDVSPPDLDAVLSDLEITRQEVDDYLTSEGRPIVADLDDAKRAALAGHMSKIADKIRARRTA